jgi:hypothetical protein
VLICGHAPPANTSAAPEANSEKLRYQLTGPSNVLFQAFQQSDPAAFTSLTLFHGKHGSRLIAGMGREWGDAGEEVNCETLRTDAHNQAMRRLVRGDQPTRKS